MKKLIAIGLAIPALALAAAAMSSGGTGDAAVHVHPQATASATPQELAPMLADARLATAKYATSLKRAKRDGYRIIVTQHIPDMGHHFLNPSITGFDITKPPILVYVNTVGPRTEMAARRLRVGLHGDARHPAATRRAVRIIRGRMPLRRRHLRAGRGRGRLPAEEPREPRQVRLLAPQLRDPPPLGLVPQPGRDLQRHEPTRATVQRRLISILRKVSPGPRAWAPCFHVTR